MADGAIRPGNRERRRICLPVFHPAWRGKKKTELTTDRGRSIYNDRCYFCHGYSGDANTVAARFLDPKPRAFSGLAPSQFDRGKFIDTVLHGSKGTAMQAFAGVLSRADAEAVVDYVAHSFIEHKRSNTRYHTPENGWPDHERYRGAFPFVFGTVALDTPEDELTPEQRAGKQLFVSSCIVCHDRVRLNDDRTVWEPRAVSYPRGSYSHRGPVIDSESSATPYAAHDQAPQLTSVSESARRGETLFQSNCAFCHAADGTGRNWIGRFLQPPPQDLTAADFRAAVTPERLRHSIANGVAGSAMSAWKSVLSAEEIDAVAAYVDHAFIHPDR